MEPSTVSSCSGRFSNHPTLMLQQLQSCFYLSSLWPTLYTAKARIFATGNCLHLLQLQMTNEKEDVEKDDGFEGELATTRRVCAKEKVN